MIDEPVVVKNGKMVLDPDKDKWPSFMKEMDNELLGWVIKLSSERVNNDVGRAVPSWVYKAAIDWMREHKPDIVLLSCESIGVPNTLFCGHFIYPA